MATLYPGGLDDFTNPTATDALDSVTVPHASQHSDLNDAVEAVEATLGVDPQGGFTDVVSRLDGVDTALGSINIYSQVSAADVDILLAGGDPGEVDDSAPVLWFKFTVDGTEYGVPVYAINPVV